jgi:GTP-binding protein
MDLKKFVDKVKIFLKAGDGGDGCVSFRREKFVPMGGPDGGNGGRGGDIYIVASKDINNLVNLALNPHIRAEDGEDGKGSNMDGKNGRDFFIYVPCGTVIKDENENFISELLNDGQNFLIAKGGRGGRGNSSFKSSTNQAPRFRELGEKGEEKTIILELKLIADVGLVGFPNAGKSTFLSRVTKATPKIANYPFTTLSPNIGVCFHKEKNFIIADIPGLIEGASKGKGLGYEFLRHISRTKLLLHLVDPYGFYDVEPVEGIKILENELKRYSEELLRKERIIVVNKSDLTKSKDVWQKIKKKYRNRKIFLISSVTGEGINELLDYVIEKLDKVEIKDDKPINECKEPKIIKIEKAFWVEKRGSKFYVYGKKVENLVARTDTSNENAIKKLFDIFKRTGVIKSLLKNGIKNGDTVVIGNVEFEWKDDKN